jgi:hypothetical protein
MVARPDSTTPPSDSFESDHPDLDALEASLEEHRLCRRGPEHPHITKHGRRAGLLLLGDAQQRAAAAAMRTLLAVTVVFLAGCTGSLAEIRAKPAERALEASGRYADLGGCVAAGLQEAPASGPWGFVLKPGDLRLVVVRRDDQQNMTVTGYRGGGMDFPALDLAFRQKSERVHIELREGTARQGLLDDTWAIVERCASQAARG